MLKAAPSFKYGPALNMYLAIYVKESGQTSFYHPLFQCALLLIAWQASWLKHTFDCSFEQNVDTSTSHLFFGCNPCPLGCGLLNRTFIYSFSWTSALLLWYQRKGHLESILTFGFAKDSCYYTVDLSFTLEFLSFRESKVTRKPDLDAHKGVSSLWLLL